MAISNVLSTAVSGLALSARRTESAAQNIVNAGTPSYTAVRAAPVSLHTGSPLSGGAGVTAQLIASDEPVDITREIVTLIEAEITYKANAEAVRTAEELSEALIDTVA